MDASVHGVMLSDAVREKLNKPFYPLVQAGRDFFGLGPVATFAAAKSGDLPAVKIGRRQFVPSSHLWKLLGPVGGG